MENIKEWNKSYYPANIQKIELKMLSTGLSCTPKLWNDEYGQLIVISV
jgi:hypothetical protein